MSISKQVTIWCDECSTWHMISDTAKNLRKLCKEQYNWITSLPNGKDYCSEECKIKAEKRKLKVNNQ